MQAYELQDVGFNTVEANHALGFKADLRNFSLAAGILHDLAFHAFVCRPITRARNERLAQPASRSNGLIEVDPTTFRPPTCRPRNTNWDMHCTWKLAAQI